MSSVRSNREQGCLVQRCASSQERVTRGDRMAQYDIEEARRLLKAPRAREGRAARIAAAALLDTLSEALEREWSVERGSFLGSRSVEIHARQRVIVFHDDHGAIGIAAGQAWVRSPGAMNLVYDPDTDRIVSFDGRDALVVLSTHLAKIVG